jgi:hypothetical protein
LDCGIRVRCQWPWHWRQCHWRGRRRGRSRRSGGRGNGNGGDRGWEYGRQWSCLALFLPVPLADIPDGTSAGPGDGASDGARSHWWTRRDRRLGHRHVSHLGRHRPCTLALDGHRTARHGRRYCCRQGQEQGTDSFRGGGVRPRIRRLAVGTVDRPLGSRRRRSGGHSPHLKLDVGVSHCFLHAHHVRRRRPLHGTVRHWLLPQRHRHPGTPGVGKVSGACRRPVLRRFSTLENGPCTGGPVDGRNDGSLWSHTDPGSAPRSLPRLDPCGRWTSGRRSPHAVAFSGPALAMDVDLVSGAGGFRIRSRQSHTSTFSRGISCPRPNRVGDCQRRGSVSHSSHRLPVSVRRRGTSPCRDRVSRPSCVSRLRLVSTSP